MPPFYPISASPYGIFPAQLLTNRRCSRKQLKNLLKTAEIVSSVNQVEFHPFDYDPKLPDSCKSKDIVVEEYSPLTRGKSLEHPAILEVARCYNKRPAQVMIRWALQHSTVVISKSSRQGHILENANVFDVKISEEDMQKLNRLSKAR